VADDTSLRQTRHEEGFHALREQMGVGRNNVFWWRCMAVLAVPALIAVAAHDILEPQPLVETVAVLFDEEMRVIHTAQARTWTFDEQAKADVARNWVFDMRNRNEKDYATALLRERARHYTGDDTVAVTKATTMLTEMDEKLKCDAEKKTCKMGLAARDIRATPIGSDEQTNATVVRVEWKENTVAPDGQAGPTQLMYMYLHVQPIEPINTQRVMANGHGLYVVDISPVGTGRPADVVAAQ
jgi:hypothetical protein